MSKLAQCDSFNKTWEAPKQKWDDLVCVLKEEYFQRQFNEVVKPQSITVIAAMWYPQQVNEETLTGLFRAHLNMH